MAYEQHRLGSAHRDRGTEPGNERKKNEILMGLFTFRLLMITFSPFDGFWLPPDQLERIYDLVVVVVVSAMAAQ